MSGNTNRNGMYRIKRNYMTKRGKYEAYLINGTRWWHQEHSIRTNKVFNVLVRSLCRLYAVHRTHSHIHTHMYITNQKDVYHSVTYLLQQQNCTIAF